jgi:hypothetical protein
VSISSLLDRSNRWNGLHRCHSILLGKKLGCWVSEMGPAADLGGGAAGEKS